MIIHMFDTELNNFNNFVNDFKLKKKFKGGEVTLGYYKSYQNIQYNPAIMSLLASDTDKSR